MLGMIIGKSKSMTIRPTWCAVFKSS